MVRSKLLPALFLAGFITTAHAGEYLGFNFATDTEETVSAKLKGANATFSTEYGYKGRDELRMFAVSSYAEVNKFGPIKDSTMYFTEKHKLYGMTFKIADPGEQFKVLRDALDAKYKRKGQNGDMFNAKVVYTTPDKTEITLSHDDFGFSENKSTTLEYFYLPASNEVLASRAKVDADIKKANANKAGGNL